MIKGTLPFFAAKRYPRSFARKGECPLYLHPTRRGAHCLESCARTSRLLANSLISTTPATKPPMCAKNATPPVELPESDTSPLITWMAIQYNSIDHAGSAIDVRKNPIGTSV